MTLEQLISVYQNWAAQKKLVVEEPKVQVDKIAAKVAAFYETIRKIVGWTEEHLLRKAAIARILRRTIRMRTEGESLAEQLIKDLVRGGYFPNNTIPQRLIPSLDQILGKYLFLIEKTKKQNGREKFDLEDWLLSVAGCEVEAFLDPPVREEALLEFTTEEIKRRLQIDEKAHFNGQERENLIFIAVRQALMKLDEPIITYHLLKKYVPRWTELTVERDREALEKFGEELTRWQVSIRKTFNHSFLGKFYWAAETFDTPYLILGDILTDLAEANELGPESLADKEQLKTLAFARYNRRLKRQRGRAFRAAIYSTISIFVTKVGFTFFIEVPFDRWIGQFSQNTLYANLGIPPALMILIVLWGLRPLPQSNAVRVVEELTRITEGNPKPYFLKLPTRQPFLIRGLVALLYTLGAAITLAAIIYGLTRLNFSALSQAVFLFFVSLIAYAGTRIRERSKELVVDEAPPGFIHDVFVFFTFPIVETGKWFSKQLLRIRSLVIILDILIESPVQFLVEFVDQWRSFLREKKQEIR